MPVTLKGACHCRRVRFELESNTPVPYQVCQCSICRKTSGYMGTVNIMGNADTLKLEGKEHIKEYSPALAFDGNTPTKVTTAKRSFCGVCSSVLWNAHPEYPAWIYPCASVVETPLPAVPEGKGVCIMRASCPDYVPLPQGGFQVYSEYAPGAGIAAWHKENGLWVD